MSKRLIVFIFLLVVLSLTAHVLTDIQHADTDLQNLEICLLHIAFLLPVTALTLMSPTFSQLPQHKDNPRLALTPVPFHPPIH